MINSDFISNVGTVRDPKLLHFFVTVSENVLFLVLFGTIAKRDCKLEIEISSFSFDFELRFGPSISSFDLEFRLRASISSFEFYFCKIAGKSYLRIRLLPKNKSIGKIAYWESSK